MIKSALQVFTRAPIPGQTKTRLIPLLGAQGAAEFHQTLLRKTLAVAKASNFETLEIWCDEDVNHPFLLRCRQDFSCRIHLQQGNDLGEKMSHVMQTVLEENDCCVLIGSDCPAITVDILNQSYQQLSEGKDAVLGSSKDGGYYLIGLRKSNFGVFQGIRWSENDVAERTRQNFIDLGLNYIELASLADIDTPDDYQKHIGFP